MSRHLSPLLLLLVACGGSTDSDADTATTGQAQFADASDREPARPQQSFTVSVEVAGSGDLEGLDPSCLDGATGAFEGLLTGTAEIDEGVYFAGLARGSAGFTTPAGCAIDDLEITALTEVVVRAELAVSAPTCDAYCGARARQSAEAECAGDGDEAACRGAAEGEYQASCTVACEQSGAVIAAETELSAAARTELVASQLAGSSLGTIAVDLTFDAIEDASGGVVEEQ